ncbi:MAG: hypothetical protein P8O22_00330 [Akkermansiaceae bacterium]|nr:hypothetical protein [Akkermansiaceae bacterium]
MSRHNILLPLSLDDVDVVWKTLKSQRFEFSERDYAHFTSKRNGLHVTIYEKGPKMLIQGHEAVDFAREVMEPLVAGKVMAKN